MRGCGGAWRLWGWLVALACLGGGGRVWAQAGVPAGAPVVLSASGVAFDAAGNLFIADARGNRVFEATLAGVLEVVAGTGVQGFGGDGGAASTAELNGPEGLAVGPDGTLYVADTGNDRVRAISAAGVITTVAGTGVPGFGGDGGAAAQAMLRGPTALAVDAAGRLLVCDTGNQRVRVVTAGAIATVAGSGVQGFSGDGGPAVAAMLDSPGGVAVDGSGGLIVADAHNHRLRRVSAAGVITTMAGTGVAGFGGDGGPALQAMFSGPRGLALLADGSVLVADMGNRRVRRVAADGVVTTVAGSGIEGAVGDGIAGGSSAARSPRAVAVSGFGVPVFADADADAVSAVVNLLTLYRPAAMSAGRVSGVSAGTALAMTYGQGSVAAVVIGPIGTPAGQVEVQDGATVVSNASLSDGKTVLDVSSLAAGTHALTVRYLGDGWNPAATASLQATVAPAMVTALAQPATMAYGAAVPALTGVLSGVLPVDSAQVAASYSVAAGGVPGVGVYAIQASLAGARAGNYTVQMAGGSGQLTVTKAGAAVALAGATQGFTGIPLTLQATVAPGTRGVPTGTVQFLDGNTVVASGVLSGGVASAVYGAPPGGARPITAQYLGDGNFLPGSSPVTSVVLGALPDFVVASTGPAAASAAAGTTTTYTVTVSAQPGPFTGAISLSAAGLPAGATVAFSPPQVVPGAGSATVTVMVQTAASAATAERAEGRRSEMCGLGLLAVGLLCGRRRRGVRLPATICCALGLAVALSGCGARTVGEGLHGVVSQTYTLQVTGTATNLAGAVVSHSVPLTLTITE